MAVACKGDIVGQAAAVGGTSAAARNIAAVVDSTVAVVGDIVAC